MILICDNCHHLFDPDTFHGDFVGLNMPIPQSCPFCGESTVIYKISTGEICVEKTCPAIRYASSNESYTYEQAILKVCGSRRHNDNSDEAKARIEEAINLTNSVADMLSDDEYNMLLIFTFLYGHSTDARIWLKPILGISRFRPGSHGRSADPRFDTVRVYENATKLFISFIAGRDHYQNPLCSDANYVASLMRTDNIVPTKKGMTRTYKAAIKNIPIQSLCSSPSEVYLSAIRELVKLCENIV